MSRHLRPAAPYPEGTRYIGMYTRALFCVNSKGIGERVGVRSRYWLDGQHAHRRPLGQELADGTDGIVYWSHHGQKWMVAASDYRDTPLFL